MCARGPSVLLVCYHVAGKWMLYDAEVIPTISAVSDFMHVLVRLNPRPNLLESAPVGVCHSQNDTARVSYIQA